MNPVSASIDGVTASAGSKQQDASKNVQEIGLGKRPPYYVRVCVDDWDGNLVADFFLDYNDTAQRSVLAEQMESAIRNREIVTLGADRK